MDAGGGLTHVGLGSDPRGRGADHEEGQERDGSAGCPTVTITDQRPDPAALARVFADPNCYTHQEIAPGGFTPSFSGVITDVSRPAPAASTSSRRGRPRAWGATPSSASR